MQSHRDEDAFMVPGMGAQPVPVKEWVPANDNEPVVEISDHYRGAVESWMDRGLRQERAAPGELDVRDYGARGNALTGGQYVGLRRASNQPPVDFQLDANVMSSPLNVMPTGYHVEPAASPSWVPSGTTPIYSSAPRKGDWLQTYTGKTFHPMDPRVQDVDIRDIAHSLSMQCRYAGHCRRFYSVAEHSVLIARWLVGKQRDAALYGLLHDASEAYLVDVPRPVKPYLTGYHDAEARVQAAVWARFGLYAAVPAIVKEADDRILADELVNMTRMSWHARHADPLGVPMMYWSPAEAEREFLATYTALTGEVV